MRRLKVPTSDKGASAVIVAIVLLVLMGFAALSVDVGVMMVDKKELQNGADAGALAIAQACAEGSCGSASDPAWYAKSNKGDDAEATGAVLDKTSNSVTVRTEYPRTHWFAPLLMPSLTGTTVSATSKAVWGAPGSAMTLPFTISDCWFYYQTGSLVGVPPDTSVEYVIPLKSKSSQPDGGLTCGTQSAHNETAGGFGWVDVSDATNCTVSIDLTEPSVSADTGDSGPACMALQLAKLKYGDRMLMPVFDKWSGTGTNAEYTIKAFAAFEITGYCFGNGTLSSSGMSWPGSVGWSACQKETVMKEDWGRNIKGRFVKWVQLSDADLGGAVDMGAKIVRLRLPDAEE